MIDVSIVIPTFNREYVLKIVIEALLIQSYNKEKYEIIIADDGSTDGTENIVSDINKFGGQNPKVIYLKQAQNKKGPASANNLGIRKAAGKYILFLNDDVIADQNLIKEHMKFHSKFDNIIVQGAVINTPSLENLKEKHKGYSGGYTNLSLGYFTTWNCSIKKDLLVKAGLFDEDFVNLCWEDVELGHRLRKMGIKQKNNKNAFGYHYKKEFVLSDLANIKEKSINMGKNALIYFRKHPTLEVKISTQSFWLPKLIYIFLKIIIGIIGRSHIYNFLKYLDWHNRKKLLGFFVGLAGYYWYSKGTKSKIQNPKSKQCVLWTYY